MDNSSLRSDNTSTGDSQREAFQKYQFIPLTIIIIIGFVANVLVIYAGRKKNSRRKYTTNSFILNLSIADLGMTCYYIPIHFVEYTHGLSVENWTCQYIIPVRDTFSVMSIMAVTALSVVRIIQVHRAYVLSRRLTNIIIFTMWFVTYCTVSLPLSLVFRHTPEDTCDPIWTSQEQRKIYVAFLDLIILLPLVVTTCCYICIILKMRKFNRGSNSRKLELHLKSHKISVLLCLLVVANWLGLVPFLIYSMLAVFIEFFSKYPYEEWSIMTVLFLSTSAINPVLILIASKDYRNEIRHSLCKRERIMPLVFQRVRIEAKVGYCFENPVTMQINKLS